MAPKLSDPSQPLALRAVFLLYEFLASLKLAVVLILSLAVLLGTATFVEANYGTAAVGFLVYHTWFFATLLALLAVNIFCAAAIRFPWKRHQTGFVVTHVGLLTLLAGSAISDRGSVNSQMLVFLGDSSRVAIDMDQSVLTVADIPNRPEPLQVRFHPGPFNWSDLAPYPVTRRIKSWFELDDPAKPWRASPKVLYDQDGTKIEIVDYFGRSEVRRTPYLGLLFRQPALKFEIPVDLEFDATHSELPFAKGSLGGIGDVMMWKSSDPDALAAFKESKPDRTVEGEGAVVFWSKGEVFSVSVAELKKLKQQGKRFPINDHLSVELRAYADSADLHALVSGKGLVPKKDDGEGRGVGPAVQLVVYEKTGAKETPHELVRFAELPFLPDRKRPAGFFAEFYHPQMRGRVDILIGPADKLAFRAWQQKLGRVVASGDLEVGKPVDTFSMGGGERVMKMTARRFVSHGDSGPRGNEIVLPLPFEKGDKGETKRLQMRVTRTDPQSGETKADTFWLKQNLPEPWEDPRRQVIHETNVGTEKPIRASYNVKQTDVGFAVELVDFDLEVDPGTKTAGNYTSHILQVDVRNDRDIERLRARIGEARDPNQKQALRDDWVEAMQKKTDATLALLKDKSPGERRKIAESDNDVEDQVITMNRPLDYPDLEGRQLRFFQENYIPPDKARGTPLASVFRVNYDPGRPVKYLGSGLIVFGIFLMFYMRAYFFKRPAKGTTS
jgi:hypothetical protein